MRYRALLTAISLATLAVLVVPLAYLVIRAGGAGTEAWRELLELRTLQVAARSLLLAAAVSATAILVAVPYAWLSVRTDLPLRKLWLVLGPLPLVIPSYVGALTMVGAFGPRGVLQKLLSGPFGVERLPEIYGFWGAYVTLTLFTYPYVLLIVASAYQRMDVSLERAARTLGQSRIGTFRRVTLPQLRGAIAAGGLLCALYVLSDFGVVSIMRYNTFTREIFVHYRSLYDATGAAVLSVVLCALTLLVLIAERQLRGAGVGRRRRVQAREDFTPTELGVWRVPALIYCVLLAGMALVVPAAVLIGWLINPGQGADLSTQVSELWGAISGSLASSALAAIACALLALPIALRAVRYPSRIASMIEGGAYIGFALPGVVAALGIVFFATRYARPLYQTVWLLVLVYLIKFLPQAIGSTRTSLERIDPKLEAAARGMGAGRFESLRRITLPLAGPGVLAGAMLVFLTAMKELPATLILRPTGFDTLATEIWQKTSVSAYSEAALPALVLVGISAIPLYLLVIRTGSPSRSEAAGGSSAGSG